MFSKDQIALLSDKLDPANVKQRTQAGFKLSYVEGWHAIAEANRIFGFGDWTRETLSMECVWSNEIQCTYVARVRITVCGEDGTEISREGTGAGHGQMKKAGDNHESASKEAETDAMKRALMTFGNPFGLALYDKEQTEVGTPQAEVDAQAETDKKWIEERIAVCNETEWTEENFDAWKQGIRDELKAVRKRDKALSQSLIDAIEERAAMMNEAGAQAAAE